MKNRVAKLVEIGKIQLMEEELPRLEKDEVLVAIKSVGICGSDMHYFLEGGLGTFKQPLPMYMGHECSGVVIESKSEAFIKGDRVAVEPGKPCLDCRWCLVGRHNLCLKGTFMGATSQGAFADYVIVSPVQLAKMPDSMSYHLGALLEPLGVALHAVNLTSPTAKDSAVIFGAGSIGMSMLSILRKFGLRTIYMVDILPHRVSFAKKMGATDAFLLKDSVSRIMEKTKKLGVAFAFDAAGTNEAIDGCTAVVSPGGTIGLIGIPTEDFIRYNPHKLRTKEVTIKNVRRSNQTLEDCIRLYSADPVFEKVVTHEFPLNEIQKGFELVGGYKDKVIKCMITNNPKI